MTPLQELGAFMETYAARCVPESTPLLGAPGATPQDLVGAPLVLLAGDVAEGLERQGCWVADVTALPAEDPAAAVVVLTGLTEHDAEFEVTVRLTGHAFTLEASGG
jgi:hypothetical protein